MRSEVPCCGVVWGLAEAVDAAMMTAKRTARRYGRALVVRCLAWA
jgi:hypothetical protein